MYALEDCTAAEEHMRNVTICNKVFHGVRNARMALNIKEADRMNDIAIQGNLFQFACVPKPPIRP
jgi:hypothetical protein